MKILRPLVYCLVLAATVAAEPGPGDVFREFTYGMRFGQMDLGSKRPNLEAMRARSEDDRNLELPSLKNVIKAEVSVEYWGGHVGTSEQKFRINDGSWTHIAQPEGTPGKPECFHRTVLGRSTVSVPVESLKQGRNAFRFMAGPQVCHSFDWGFYWVYAFTVRLYYDPVKAGQVGKITSPAEGDEISDHPRLVAEAHKEEIPIANVEFIGKFEDFNWEGNGVYRQWHYITQRGQLGRHIGSAALPPYAVTWDTSWVPDQAEPVELMARVTDADGLIHMTPSVKVKLKRSGRSVRMYKAKDIPPAFAVRVGRRKDCKFEVSDNLSRARAAKIVVSTWSAAHGDEIGFNGTKLVDRVGLVHNYSFDSIPVPVRLLKPGQNAFEMFSKTEHHALEVNWPGPVLMVEYGPETPKPAAWSEPEFKLRIPIEVKTGALAEVKMPALQGGMKLVEVDPSGRVSDPAVPFQLESDSTLVFALKNQTGVAESRRFFSTPPVQLRPAALKSN